MIILQAFLRFIRSFLLFLLGAWIIGFIWFIWQTQKTPSDTKTQCDAIVVLTGGQNRIEKGYQLFEQKLGKELFISGVSKKLDLQRLTNLYHLHPELKDLIHIGYEAKNTEENASETIDWLMKRGHKSVRLVTAGYHMPRSLLEFQRSLTKISPFTLRIIPHPITPSALENEHLWSFGVMRLLLREYIKFLVIRLKIIMAIDATNH